MQQALAAFRRWLFRLHGPEAAPIVLGQRRIFVLPTRAGLAYAATLLLMLVGAINYNLSLGYALIFLLAGLGVAAMLNTFRNLLGLGITPGRTAPVFAGDTARVILHLHNPRRGARHALRLHFPDGPTVTIDVAAEDVATVVLPLPTRRRGWLHPGRLTIETDFPLCLVRAWSYVEPQVRCLVYPRPEAVCPPLPLSPAAAAGGGRGGRSGEDFAGLRPHQPADSPRQVAWKAVAREQPLVTKQFAGAAAAPVWLDWDDLPPALDVETRLARLTRWLLQAHEQGLACGLRLPGRTLPPGRGEHHLHQCLEALALYGG